MTNVDYGTVNLMQLMAMIYEQTPVTEFIDPVLGMKMIVFAKISPKRSFSIQSVPRDAGLSLFWMRVINTQLTGDEIRMGNPDPNKTRGLPEVIEMKKGQDFSGLEEYGAAKIADLMAPHIPEHCASS